MNTAAITANIDVSAMMAGNTKTTTKTSESSFGNVLSRALGQTEAATASTEISKDQKSLQDVVQLIIDVLSGEVSAEQAGEILGGDGEANDEIADILTKLIELLKSDDDQTAVKLEVLPTKSDDEELLVEAVQMLMQIIEYVQVNTSDNAEIPEELVQAVKLIFPEKSTAEVKEILTMASQNLSAEKSVTQASRFVIPAESSAIKQSMTENAEPIVNVQITTENNTSAKQPEIAKFAAAPVKIANKTNELEEIIIPNVLIAKTAETAPTFVEGTVQTAQPVEQQILQTVTQQLTTEIAQDGVSKVTMQLVPESLGELSIEISKKGDEISVVISAKELMTQKLIEEKLPTLMAALKTNDNVIKEIIVVPAQQSNGENLGDYLSSNFSQKNQNHQQQNNTQTGNLESIQLATEESTQKILKQGGLLWQTA